MIVAFGIVGKLGGDFEGDEAIGATALREDRSQHAERVDGVVDGHLPVGGLDRVVLHERAELVVVGVLAR